MIHIETSKQGAAAVARRAPRNPIQLLVDIIDGDPTAGSDRLFRKWREAVEADEDYLTAALLHAFTNILHSLDRDRRRPQGQQLKKARAERSERVSALRAMIVEKVLNLDFIMHDGRPLAEWTGTQLGKLGSVYTAIAEKVGRRRVGSVIRDDAELRAFFKG